MKRRYAAVGTGGRIPMFIDPIVDRYKEQAELVGLCDSSVTRRSYHQQRLVRQYGIEPMPVYDDFGMMLREQKPDVVIVCTPDFLHHKFIIESLEFGVDVISEKPLTIDASKCRAVFEAIERTGRKVQTTFNYRWAPGASKVRELISQGAIGNVKHVDFEYALNTSHGADYFRRWHSQKEFSGGLLVHKATHHFDLINWWIDAIPATVFAMGDLVFYGRNNAVARGDEAWTRYGRYTGSEEAAQDPFRISLEEDQALRELYLNAESDSGYLRDQNVFRDGISIEDSMSVLVKYRTGAMLAYSLNAYSPVEGFHVTISGDRGRIEFCERHASHIITGSTEPLSDADEKQSKVLQLRPLFSPPVDVPIPNAAGGHGGGDPLLQEQLFSVNPPQDPLRRTAGHEQGAASLLVGAAANESIASGKPVNINDLMDLNIKASCLSELI